jgi:hypothetical protein
MAASQAFDYSALAPEYQAQLRQIASHIHTIGCGQTAAAVEIGNKLIEAKVGLEHGQFGKWCEVEAGYGARRAQLLMNLANFACQEPDVLRIPVSAGYLLSAPSVPEHIIREVLSLAKGGGRVTVSWVEKLLNGQEKEESKQERSSASEVTKIAKLIAGALHPSEATTLRKLLEAAGAPLIQQFVCELQGHLRDKLRGAVSVPLIQP